MEVYEAFSREMRRCWPYWPRAAVEEFARDQWEKIQRGLWGAKDVSDEAMGAWFRVGGYEVDDSSRNHNRNRAHVAGTALSLGQ